MGRSRDLTLKEVNVCLRFKYSVQITNTSRADSTGEAPTTNKRENMTQASSVRRSFSPNTSHVKQCEELKEALAFSNTAVNFLHDQ